MDRIISAIRTRPVRVVEAVVALIAVLGFVLAPETEQAIIGLVVALVTLAGGEAAQTQTTSTYAPRIDDDHGGEV